MKVKSTKSLVFVLLTVKIALKRTNKPFFVLLNSKK